MNDLNVYSDEILSISTDTSSIDYYITLDACFDVLLKIDNDKFTRLDIYNHFFKISKSLDENSLQYDLFHDILDIISNKYYVKKYKSLVFK